MRYVRSIRRVLTRHGYRIYLGLLVIGLVGVGYANQLRQSPMATLKLTTNVLAVVGLGYLVYWVICRRNQARESAPKVVRIEELSEATLILTGRVAGVSYADATGAGDHPDPVCDLYFHSMRVIADGFPAMAEQPMSDGLEFISCRLGKAVDLEPTVVCLLDDWGERDQMITAKVEFAFGVRKCLQLCGPKGEIITFSNSDGSAL